MASYVDNSAQTIIAGLTKHPSSFPAVLSPTDQTTPPDDMPTKQLHLPTYDAPGIPQTESQNQPPSDIMDQNTSPSLLLRRKKRPPMITRISLPAADMELLDVEGPRSPPGTEAVLSPLPAANKLHAGHTPIFPRSLSPLRHLDNESDRSGPTTPDHESVLSGPLTLPAEPGAEADDRIELKVLDAELEKIAKEQDIGRPANTELKSSPSQNAENGGQPSRKGSNENRRRSSADEVVVDGVILKKPRMNLGAPLGQVCE